MQYKNLKDYLTKSGVLKGTPDQIEIAKAEYRRIYQREYKRRRRSQNKEISLLINTKLHKRLLRVSKKTGTTIQEVIIRSLEEQQYSFVELYDRKVLEKLIQLLANIHSEITYIADKGISDTPSYNDVQNKVLMIEVFFMRMLQVQTTSHSRSTCT